jgi:TRAP-type C4-dicarboxylate transport system permease small subunit
MQAILARLQRAQLTLAGLALVVMTLVTVADVFMRYAFSRPVRGAYDIVECALVVFVFHGMAAVFFRRQNIVINLIDAAVGPMLRGALVRVSDIVSIGCLALLGWAMLTPAWQAYLYGDYKIELGLPLFVLWILAGSGMIGTILCAIGAFLAGPAVGDGTPPS